MTREEAIYRLKNTAWLGTDKDREETEQAVDMAIEALSADRPIADKCDDCLYEDSDKSLFPCTYCKRNHFDKYEKDESNNITKPTNDVIESKDDVIKKPRTVRYKLHKPIEYVSIEFDEEEEITHIDHYTAYGERREL